LLLWDVVAALQSMYVEGIVLFVYGAGTESSPLLLHPFISLLCQPLMIDGDDCGAVSGLNERQVKPKHWKKTCPSAALSITDST
jgi:hypothetical protein